MTDDHLLPEKCPTCQGVLQVRDFDSAWCQPCCQWFFCHCEGCQDLRNLRRDS